MTQHRTTRVMPRQAIPLLLMLVFAFCIRNSALGTSVEFDIQPRAIRVGEAALASFTIKGLDNPPQPALPPIPDVQVGFAGRSQETSIVTENGRMRQDSSITYRYQLVPLKTGKFTIGPFTYAAHGETVDLPAVTLDVVAPDAGSTSGGEPQEWSDLLFAVLSAARTNIYSLQMFDIDLAIYSKGLNLGGEIQLMNMPTAGLSLQPFRELGGTREVVNNQIYDVRRFRARAQALTAGTFRLEPVLRVGIRVQRERRRQDPFGMFGDSFFDDFFGSTRTVPQDVRPQPLELVVRPLPAEGQPAGFSGAVGRFNFDMQVKPTEVSAGDPITLTMQIVGDGNVENVSAPEIAAGDHFKVYEPKLVSKDITDGQAAGRKVFEQVVIPRSADAKDLPALTFTYFDPDQAAYQSITRGPFPLTVRPSSGTQAKVLQAAPEESARTVLLGTDIVYLKPAPARWRHPSERLWYVQPAFVVLQTVPLIGLAVLFLTTRRREVLARDIARARRERAPRAARSALKKAESAAARGEQRAFFEALWEALASYFGDRLNLAAGEIAFDTVMSTPLVRALDPESFEKLRDLFLRCEAERFGSGGAATPGDRTEFDRLLRDLMGVFRTCERSRA